MAQTRQSGPEARTAPSRPTHSTPPGGPVKPGQQGYRNPGATPNLRGVEANTGRDKGNPNPQQQGSHGKVGGDHNPGFGQAGDQHTHGVQTPVMPPQQDGHAARGKTVVPRKPERK